MQIFTDDKIKPEEDTLKDRYLLFSVDTEVYGIEIKYVTEIVGMHDITHVPQLPDFIKGIINLRGSIIPVMDVRIRFKKETTQYDGRTSIVIINFGNVSLGLIVDKAIEVATVVPEEILPPPEIKSSYHNLFVKGVSKFEGKIRLLLDCEKLINEEDQNAINQAL